MHNIDLLNKKSSICITRLPDYFRGSSSESILFLGVCILITIFLSHDKNFFFDRIYVWHWDDAVGIF